MPECNVRLPEKTTYSNPDGPMTCNLWAKKYLSTNASNISMILTHPLIPFPFTNQPFGDQNPAGLSNRRGRASIQSRAMAQILLLSFWEMRAGVVSLKKTPKRKRVVLVVFHLFSLGSNSKQRPKEAPSCKNKKHARQDESPEPIGWVQLTPNRFR